MRFWLAAGLVVTALTQAGCLHRRCDTWADAQCRAVGAPAVQSPVRVYAFGAASKVGEERARAMALLEKTLASEDGPTDRVLTVLGDNLYRGLVSSEADIADGKAFYGKLFKLTDWKKIVVVPGNRDHGAFRAKGFDAKAIEAEKKWFLEIDPSIVYPDAADPRAEAPWVSVPVPGHEQCLTLQAVDSHGFRENLLALPAPKAASAWNLAVSHHGTRTAANHMGDRSREETRAWADALAATDLVLGAHENVLFADLAPSGEDHPGPPGITAGSFSMAKRLKAPEYTSCAAEQTGFVRLSVDGDALVADFFAVAPGGAISGMPYCTQRLEKPGAAAQCGGSTATLEAAAGE